MAPTLTPGTPPVASLRGELRYGFELARLLANRDFLRPARAPAEPAVLLVPGFMAGDQSLGVLAGWLRRRGSRTERAGIVLNADCAERAVGGIESRLHRFAEEAGGPVVLIGQSRGGELARVVALRNPDLVSSLVMLGSPVLDPLRVGPVVLGAVRYVARLGDLGVPGMFSSECGDGAVLRPVPRGPARTAARGRARRVDLLALGRDRRLGGVPGPVGRAHRGGVEPRRHVGQRDRSTGSSPASSTRRAIDGLDEPHGRLVPPHRGTDEPDAHRRREHLRGAGAAVRASSRRWSTASWASSRGTARRSASSPSASAARSGWTTRTSTSPTTCATAPCRRRAPTSSCGARPRGSSPSASTAASRSGRSGCSRD